MTDDATFNEVVAWAREHVHAAIRQGDFDRAVWAVCERVAGWRMEQDERLGNAKDG